MPRIRQYEERYAAEDFRKEVRIRQGERDLMSVSALAEEADIGDLGGQYRAYRNGNLLRCRFRE